MSGASWNSAATTRAKKPPFRERILQGAPRIRSAIEGELRELVAEKSAVLLRWMDEGRIARVHPVHLIFSIWALTQHYADFDTHVRGARPRGGRPLPRSRTLSRHALPQAARGLIAPAARYSAAFPHRGCLDASSSWHIRSLAARARIDRALRQLHHGDAVVDGADVDAQVAGTHSSSITSNTPGPADGDGPDGSYPRRRRSSGRT